MLSARETVMTNLSLYLTESADTYPGAPALRCEGPQRRFQSLRIGQRDSPLTSTNMTCNPAIGKTSAKLTLEIVNLAQSRRQPFTHPPMVLASSARQNPPD